jgi:hypothetical protein
VGIAPQEIALRASVEHKKISLILILGAENILGIKIVANALFLMSLEETLI